MDYSMVTSVKNKIKLSHQLRSIKHYALLVPLVTSPLIRTNFHLLSENQD